MKNHQAFNHGLSPAEAAQHLGLSERKIHDALRSGHLMSEKTDQGHTVVSHSALKEYQRRHPANASGSAHIDRAQIDKATIDRATL
ncbi:MAG: helix-turn-helix domain-containing protein [Cyanobacteria bacterium P01_A01_bin.17]